MDPKSSLLDSRC